MPPQRTRNIPQWVCQTCGTTFARYIEKNRLGAGRYCSHACAAAGQQRRVARICLACGTAFAAHACDVATGRAHYCSRACADTRHPRTTTERFWALVQHTDGCWLWQGGIAPSGYGHFTPTFGSSPEGTHRYAWTLTHGPIPEGLWVLHRCDVRYPVGDISYRRCVRPDHLFLGTHQDNMDDCRDKGRIARGTRIASARLSDDTVRFIRQQLAAGVRQVTLAAMCGVSQACISTIATGKAWQHVV